MANENQTMTSSSMSTLVNVERYMSIYGPLVLTTLGIIGNILSMLIFLSPRYRRQSSHFYLLSLALSDLCFLVIYLIEDTFRNHNDIYQSRLNILDHSTTMVCVLFQYARNITRFLSSWIIVSFTIERLLVVFYPLKRAVICRRKIARCVVMILFIMGLLVNINVPFHYGIVNVENNIGQPDTICDIKEQFRPIYMRFAISTMIIVYLLPMCIIGIVNMLICCKLWSKSLLTEKDENSKSSQRRQKPMHSRRSFYLSDLLSCLHSSSSSSTNYLKDTEDHRSHRESSISQHPSFKPLIPIEIHITETNDFRVPDETKSQSMVRSYSNQQIACPTIKKQSSTNVKNYIQSRTNRVTLTLLLVSCSFLLLNSPYCAVWIANYVQHFRNTALKSIKEMTELFMLMNFCINFLLYCVSGKVFRDELMYILRCQWKQLYNSKEGKKQVRPKINLQLQEKKHRSAKK